MMIGVTLTIRNNLKWNLSDERFSFDYKFRNFWNGGKWYGNSWENIRNPRKLLIFRNANNRTEKFRMREFQSEKISRRKNIKNNLGISDLAFWKCLFHSPLESCRNTDRSGKAPSVKKQLEIIESKNCSMRYHGSISDLATGELTRRESVI